MTWKIKKKKFSFVFLHFKNNFKIEFFEKEKQINIKQKSTTSK
jgi:hypothetical protein